MLGMLIAVLHLDGIAAERCLARKRHVPLVVSLCISWRTAVAPSGTTVPLALALVRRAASAIAVTGGARALSPMTAVTH